MAKVETVYIHHDDLDAESSVPEVSVPAWEASGWVLGPLPRLQAERDAVDAQRLADVEEHAVATAAAQAEAESSRIASENGAPRADVPDVNTQIAGRPRGGRETPVTGDTNPTVPEEG